MSDQAVAEALCAIMLLEDSSPRQALADFLLARKLAIQQLLNQPHHGRYNGAASFLRSKKELPLPLALRYPSTRVGGLVL